MTVDAEHEGAVFPAWTLGDRFRKVRLTAGLDQREFAEQLGVKPGSLAAWETDRQKPRDLVAVAKRIELLTRVPAIWVLGLENPRPEDPDGGSRAPSGIRTPDPLVKGTAPVTSIRARRRFEMPDRIAG